MIENPIIIEADYDDNFSGDVDLSATATATLEFGNKSVLFSAAIGGVLAAGDWIYEVNDSQDEFAYECALVQASDSGTDDGGDSNLLIDSVSTPFTNLVLGTQIVNSTDGITGYMSTTGATSVQVTLDGRTVAQGGTVVVFDNGDSYTIADQAVLFLPYKGANAGSTKTMTNMQANPIWNTASGDFQWNFDADNYWLVKGIHIRGTDTAGQVEIDTCGGHVFRDCILEGNGASDTGLAVADDALNGGLFKCRIFNNDFGVKGSSGGADFGKFLIKDCLIDGNSVSGGVGIQFGFYGSLTVEETEMRNNPLRDIAWTGGDFSAATFTGRNVLVSTGDTISEGMLRFSEKFLQDHQGTPGAMVHVKSSAQFLAENTSVVRSGGSNVSILVTPTSRTSNVWELSLLPILEIGPFYVDTSAKTYTVHMRPTLTADWETDPTAAQLWLQFEIWGDAVFKHRRIYKSTGVIDMNGSTAWQTLTVTATPGIAGVAILSLWYGKPLEDVDTFYVDPIPVVT